MAWGFGADLPVLAPATPLLLLEAAAVAEEGKLLDGLGLAFFLVGNSVSAVDVVADASVDDAGMDPATAVALGLVPLDGETGVEFFIGPLPVVVVEGKVETPRSCSGDFSGPSFSGSKSPKKLPAKLAVSSLDPPHPMVCHSSISKNFRSLGFQWSATISNTFS